MINLVRSEILRFRSRRIVWVLSALVLIGILIGVGIGASKSHKPTAAQQARIERFNARQMALCVAGRTFPPDQVPPGQTLADYCAVVGVGTATVPNGLSLRTLSDLLKQTSFVIIVVGLVIGASVVGADWQSGTVGTVLGWEPRRVRLLLTRALVVGVSVFLLAMCFQVVLSLLFATAAALRGTTAGTGPGFLRTVAGVMGRVGLMAAFVALIGVAVSTIGRSTAASLGVVFVYLAIVEGILHGVAPHIIKWLLVINTAVFIDGHPQDVSDSSGVSASVVTLGHAVVVVATYVVVLMSVSAVWFRSRDVS